jgi:ubiquitin-protein ligase E3 A
MNASFPLFSPLARSLAFPSLALSSRPQSHIMRIDAQFQMRQAERNAMMQAIAQGQRMFAPYLVLKVRRESLIADTLTQLQMVSGTELKKPLKVQFEGEPGVDAGGVLREFFSIMIRDLFNPQYGMFIEVEESRFCWFNSAAPSDVSSEYELLGILLGLAMFNGVILDVHFPRVVFHKLLKRPLGMADLKLFNPELARGLTQLLTFEGDVQSVYERNFTVDHDVMGVTETVELKPGGAAIDLTNGNRAGACLFLCVSCLCESVQLPCVS